MVHGKEAFFHADQRRTFKDQGSLKQILSSDLKVRDINTLDSGREGGGNDVVVLIVIANIFHRKLRSNYLFSFERRINNFRNASHRISSHRIASHRIEPSFPERVLLSGTSIGTFMTFHSLRS